MNALSEFAADFRDGASISSALEKDGVVIIRGFSGRDQCEALKQRAFELIDSFDIDAHRTVFSTTTQSHARDDYFMGSGGSIGFFLEEEAFAPDGALACEKRRAVNKIGHALHDLDPVFSDFSRSPAMRAASRVAGLRSPLLLQSMVVVKPPSIGGEVTCHQDSTFLYTEPESCIGFWLALDEATAENGCMEFIPGEHKGPLRRLFRRNGCGGAELVDLVDDPYPEHKRVMVPAAVGDLVIFTGRTPHMSAANRSASPRMAYTLHMIEAGAHYPDFNWLQRPSAMPLRGF